MTCPVGKWCAAIQFLEDLVEVWDITIADSGDDLAYLKVAVSKQAPRLLHPDRLQVFDEGLSTDTLEELAKIGCAHAKLVSDIDHAEVLIGIGCFHMVLDLGNEFDLVTILG